MVFDKKMRDRKDTLCQMLDSEFHKKQGENDSRERRLRQL